MSTNGKPTPESILRTLDRFNPRTDPCPICGLPFVTCTHTIVELRALVVSRVAIRRRRNP
jgi:transposase